jgi:hypothetical protein
VLKSNFQTPRPNGLKTAGFKYWFPFSVRWEINFMLYSDQFCFWSLYRKSKGSCRLVKRDWGSSPVLDFVCDLWSTGCYWKKQFSCWLVNTETGVRAQSWSLSVIYSQQRVTERSNFTITSVFLRQYLFTNSPHSSSSTCRPYQKDKRANNTNFQTQQCSLGCLDQADG